ncbi:MAG: hypothetical protein QOH81_26, partial [Sphingomonadales bacterium]|nr:hypothetical protein [Sphingomonadales bacterium]
MAGNSVVVATVSGESWTAGDPFAPNAAAWGPGYPAIAPLPSGGFVLLYWDSRYADAGNGGYPLRGQIFSALGDKVGSEFQIPTALDGNLHRFSVTGLAGGGFVVSFTDFTPAPAGSPAASEEPGDNVWAQRFDAAGTTIGGKIAVNSITAGQQLGPSVAALASGGFVVTFWDMYGDRPGRAGGVMAQMFDAAGHKIGGEFAVPSTVAFGQGEPKIAAVPGGGFVVTWLDSSSLAASSGGRAVFAQRFDDAGNRIGASFQVSTATGGYLYDPHVAVLLDGGFVFTWSESGGSIDTSGFGIKGQRFDAAGAKIGGEFLVNSQMSGDQTASNVTALHGGGFAISWMDGSAAAGDGSGASIKAQIFDAAGARMGGEFLVNVLTTDDQRDPAAATLPWGGFVIGFGDYGGATPGNTSTVSARIFSPEPFIARSDAFLTDEQSAVSGNVFADNGSGADTAPPDGVLQVVAVNGSAAGVGNLITLASGARLMLGSDGSYLYLPNGAFNGLAAWGTGGSNQQATDSFTYTLADGAAATVTVTIHGLYSTPHIIEGSAGDDVLTGTGQADIFAASAGADSMAGGGGDDVYYVDNAGDVVTENAGGGRDEIRTSLPIYVLPTNVELLTGLSATGQSLTGNELDNIVTGGIGNDRLDGGPGNDTVNGGDGDDRIAVSSGFDFVNGGNGTDTLVVDYSATAGSVASFNDVSGFSSIGISGDYQDGLGRSLFFSGIENIEITTGAQNDRFSTGSGDDRVSLGGGDDFVNVNAGNDTADGGPGIDGITADLGLASGSIVWNLQTGGYSGPIGSFTGFEYFGRLWTGSGDDTIVTGALARDESIYAGGGNDRITVVNGSDTVDGGIGNDILVVDYSGATDRIFTGSPGASYNGGYSGSIGDGQGHRVSYWSIEAFAITGGAFSDNIGTADGNDVIAAGGGADYVLAGSGNDVIDGGTGADQMWGEAGDDVYYVDNAGDVVTENAGGGIDEVRTTLSSYTLGANVENLTGTLDTGQGLYGNALDNVVRGGAGWDGITDSAGGNDRLYGGEGDDGVAVYRYDDQAPSVVLLDGGVGADVLTFYGSRYVDAVTMAGGDGDDDISLFRGGAVTIDGGAGNDRIGLNFLGARTIITLGTGTDLIYLSANVGYDTAGGSITVTDFQTGNSGDRLELVSYLVSVLQGWNPAGNAFASGHLKLVQSGADAVLQIDADGPGGPNGLVDLVRFQNSDAASFTAYNLGGYYADGSSPGGSTILGTPGNDVLWGTYGDDLIQAQAGFDEVHGGAGNDRIEGGADRDLLDGQYGDDLLLGGGASDTLSDWSGGNDRLYGEDGNDSLTIVRNDRSLVSSVLLDGGAGNDLLFFFSNSYAVDHAGFFGGDGNDDIIVRANGVMTVDAGAGNDDVQIDFSTGLYTVTLGAGYDQLYLGGNLYHPAASGPLRDTHIVVTDFAPGELGPSTDVLFIRDYLTSVLSGWNPAANPFDAGYLRLTQQGADAVLWIDLDGSGPGAVREFVRFVNVNAGSLTAYNIDGFRAPPVINGSDGADNFAGTPGNDVFAAGGGNDFLRLQQGGDDDAAGGDGSDTFLFGAAFNSADKVDGGTGRDQIAIQGDYWTAPLTLGAGVINTESLAILPGSDTRFGDPGTNSYDYNVTMVDANVAAGVQFIVDANRLRAGEDFTFDGSAERDGSFFIYGGGGTDNLTGGLGNDAFYFGEGGQFGASDHVDGGPGGTDQLGLRGSYTIVFGATQLVGIENIGMVSALDTRFGPLGNNNNYDLTMNDGNVVAGQQMTVDAAALRSTETLTFNGSAERDGSFRVFGGAGNDHITGSLGNDILVGGRGADMLDGGAGADIFRYRSAAESSSTHFD